MTLLTDQLEGLLQAQSIELADEHLDKGRASAERIRAETKARLERLECQEELRLGFEAQRACRQLMQAAEIRRDAEQDRLRWALAQSVLAELRERLKNIVEDDTRYREVLVRYLAEACAALPEGALRAQVTTRDLERLRPQWTALVTAAAPGREVGLEALDESGESVSGGLRVYLADGSRRVDNTFEGRMARMDEALLRVIMERLFDA